MRLTWGSYFTSPGCNAHGIRDESSPKQITRNRSKVAVDFTDQGASESEPKQGPQITSYLVAIFPEQDHQRMYLLPQSMLRMT